MDVERQPPETAGRDLHRDRAGPVSRRGGVGCQQKVCQSASQTWSERFRGPCWFPGCCCNRSIYGHGGFMCASWHRFCITAVCCCSLVARHFLPITGKCISKVESLRMKSCETKLAIGVRFSAKIYAKKCVPKLNRKT